MSPVHREPRVPVTVDPQRSLATEEELVASLKATYDVVLEPVSVAGHAFSLYRVLDINALIDTVSVDLPGDEDRFPYWAQLWESSIALAGRILRERDVAGNTVLELGTGLGLAGIAAAAVGASVLLTDFDADALRFAQCNVRRNLPTDAMARVRYERRDWRDRKGFPIVDCVIGADILYERSSARPLLDLFRTVVVPDGRILLADPERATGEAFLDSAEREGFSVARTSEVVQRNGRTIRVTLAELRMTAHD